MSTRLMYAFIAGLFLMFVGYSLQSGGRQENPVISYAGLAVLLLGCVLVVASLIMQFRRGRND